MEHPASIYDYIKTEESKFETDEVQVYDNYSWNFRNHIQMCLQLRDGIFTTGSNDWLRPFKKVIEPLLELANTAEDIEVKDITLFLKNKTDKAAKFLLKKYHDEVYIKEHDIDALIDEIAESDNKLGGVLVQNGKEVPEVMKLNDIAFCDQTDILGGPIGFKYYFSPSKLRKMASSGWGDEKNGANITLDELIVLATADKEPAGSYNQKKNQTTGKNVEVFIVRGNLPEAYLKDNDNMDDYCEQLHIVAFYKNQKDKKIGVTLYRKEADEDDLMFHTSKPVEGKALGKGAVIFFHEQIWTNFLEIHKMKMLEGAAKNIIWTDDDGYTNRQQINDMDNNEVTILAEGKRFGNIPTVQAASIQLFQQAIAEKFQNAQLIGFAQDPLLGKQSFSGQTFKGQERLLQTGRGPHERTRGKRAKFIEKIYRKMIIPDMKKQILKGLEFIADLSFNDLQYVMNQLAENYANHTNNEHVLNGENVEDKQILIQQFKEDFSKKGSEHKLGILKGEFKDIEIEIEIDVVNKQFNLQNMTEKVFSIFQFIFSNPAGFQTLMQIPAMANAFSDVLEFSNIESADFASLMSAPQIAPPQPQPIQPVAQSQMIPVQT